MAETAFSLELLEDAAYSRRHEEAAREMAKLLDLLKEGLLCLWDVLGPLEKPTSHHSVDALEVL